MRSRECDVSIDFTHVWTQKLYFGERREPLNFLLYLSTTLARLIWVKKCCLHTTCSDPGGVAGPLRKRRLEPSSRQLTISVKE